MRSGKLASLTLLGLLAAAAGSGAPAPRPAAYRLDTVTLGIRHRVFHEFVDLRKVRLKQRFQIGDTDYSATVVEFVPDFAMAMQNGRVFSRSPEPHNPAFKIVVRFKGRPQDTTWAMLKMPPHFTRRSLLAFKVARIDFVGRPPLVNADTSAAPSAAAEAPHGPGAARHSGPGGRSGPDSAAGATPPSAKSPER